MFVAFYITILYDAYKLDIFLLILIHVDYLCMSDMFLCHLSVGLLIHVYFNDVLSAFIYMFELS